MEGHKMQNGALVVLSLLLLGCFSIHMAGEINQNVFASIIFSKLITTE
jgi:hypothetical protein